MEHFIEAVLKVSEAGWVTDESHRIHHRRDESDHTSSSLVAILMIGEGVVQPLPLSVVRVNVANANLPQAL